MARIFVFENNPELTHLNNLIGGHLSAEKNKNFYYSCARKMKSKKNTKWVTTKYNIWLISNKYTGVINFFDDESAIYEAIAKLSLLLRMKCLSRNVDDDDWKNIVNSLHVFEKSKLLSTVQRYCLSVALIIARGAAAGLDLSSYATVIYADNVYLTLSKNKFFYYEAYKEFERLLKQLRVIHPS